MVGSPSRTGASDPPLAFRSLASKARRRLVSLTIPEDVRTNFRPIDDVSLQRFRQVLLDTYFSDRLDFVDTEKGRAELQTHLLNRVERVRFDVVPWLHASMPLASARILEIGCGTGSDTVALTEQGAEVVAMDVHAPSLQAARARLDMYGLEADLVEGSAADLGACLGGREFDMVLFTASLEHMTLSERLVAIRDSWGMVRPGGLWGMVETPNRLWWFDGHTSQLPFYHWLPDELAFRCARMSARPRFGDVYDTLDEERMLHFLRRGRGMSFHEMVVAVGITDGVPVESDRRSYLRANRPLLGYRIAPGLNRRYHAFLRSVAPDIPPAWLMEYLEILIRKP